MLEVLGFVMIASWVYSVVIIAKKTEGLTPFETTVLVVGIVGFTLYIIGTLTA